MAKMYFTLCGCNHYFGTDFMKKGMTVKANRVSKATARALLGGQGFHGYACNSCKAAGRINAPAERTTCQDNPGNCTKTLC